MVRRMNITFTIIMMLILLISCNKVSYNNLLSEENDKYFILYVGSSEDGHHKTPEIINKITDKGKITGATLMWSLENAKKQYPELEIERSPAFLIFDTKGVVLKTYSEQEAIDFLFSR
ncbi:hypothetical protein [Cohnella luojiensis]|uniref:Thioredoxin n=1 Tax=Cohnella luojiensis TaxID=652876 RepID=A0A4Y8LU92_9BACL|nr:hypothetical protein [Cohnella luojiensis]TFE25207.1 hypothetical protein E2980_14245 [Cohnella luojiensis]